MPISVNMIAASNASVSNTAADSAFTLPNLLLKGTTNGSVSEVMIEINPVDLVIPKSAVKNRISSRALSKTTVKRIACCTKGTARVSDEWAPRRDGVRRLPLGSSELMLGVF